MFMGGHTLSLHIQIGETKNQKKNIKPKKKTHVNNTKSVMCNSMMNLSRTASE